MKYALLVMLVVSVGMAVLTLTAEDSQSAFHENRVYAVMGGADGDASVQFVELRMASGGQTILSGHDLCFFDENGDPWARFSFDDNVGSGANGSSILVGSPAMDGEWPAGEPDFTFGAGNTTTIGAGADANAPVHPGSGKVAFGSDPTAPAEMCAGSFDEIDSVAYGTGYTGSVDHPPVFASDLPTAGTQAIALQTALCTPSSNCQVNSTDYAIGDATPRNNGGASGPIGANGTPSPTSTPEPTETPEASESPEPSGSPDPSGTATPTPTPTGVPGIEITFGDIDCGGAVNAVDALKKLQFVAAIPFEQEPDCPDVGAELDVVALASGQHILWGDVNCDGAVNAVDALQDLRHIAAIGATQQPGCPAIGSNVQIVP